MEEKLIYIKKYCNKEINKKIQMLDEKIIDISNENKGIEEAYLVGGKLLDECRKLNGCSTGEAKVTKAYNLPCNMIIHTVGPIYNGGNHGEKELLRSCYINSIELGIKNHAKTIAFSAISTGVYGYPYGEACEIAFQAVLDMLKKYDDKELETVYFVCFRNEIYNKYKQLLDEIK